MTARLLALLALLAGCTTVPSVAYHQLGPGPHHDAWVPFRLTDTIVVIGTPTEAKGEAVVMAPVELARKTVRCPAAVCGPLAIAAVPADFADAVFALEPISRRLISTTIAPTYYPNSLRLKILTIEAKDHRLEAVNAIATIAAGAAHFASAGTDLANADPTDQTAELHLPVTIALPHRPCGGGCPAPSAALDLPNNAGWTYDLVFRDDPAAVGMVPRAAISSIRSAMAVAACRPARVTLHHAAQKVTVTLDVSVADPDWLVTVPFPAKGALTFHTLCGVDVQPQAITEIGVDAMATAFVNGVKQVMTPK